MLSMFWKHKWLGETSLEAALPRLFHVSTQKEAWIAEMVDVQGQHYWNLQFRRTLFDWEKVQLDNLLQLLANVQLQDSDEDCMRWCWSKDLTFSDKSAYIKREDQRFEVNKDLLSVWKNISPPKVELFTWMAVHDCIASKSVLTGRGMLNVS